MADVVESSLNFNWVALIVVFVSTMQRCWRKASAWLPHGFRMASGRLPEGGWM